MSELRSRLPPPGSIRDPRTASTLHRGRGHRTLSALIRDVPGASALPTFTGVQEWYRVHSLIPQRPLPDWSPSDAAGVQSHRRFDNFPLSVVRWPVATAVTGPNTNQHPPTSMAPAVPGIPAGAVNTTTMSGRAPSLTGLVLAPGLLVVSNMSTTSRIPGTRECSSGRRPRKPGHPEANTFGATVGTEPPERPDTATQDPGRLVEHLNAPADRPVERLDVREMGPPAPLRETRRR
ncbi:MAG: hypothetical protein ACI9CA_001744 [Natronomonas sp.]|jgi:hypothetical protein